MAMTVAAVGYSARLVQMPWASCTVTTPLGHYGLGVVGQKFAGAYGFLVLANDGEGQQVPVDSTTPQVLSRRRYDACCSALALFMRRRQGPARKLGGRDRISVDHPGGDHD